MSVRERERERERAECVCVCVCVLCVYVVYSPGIRVGILGIFRNKFLKKIIPKSAVKCFKMSEMTEMCYHIITEFRSSEFRVRSSEFEFRSSGVLFLLKLITSGVHSPSSKRNSNKTSHTVTIYSTRSTVGYIYIYIYI